MTPAERISKMQRENGRQINTPCLSHLHDKATKTRAALDGSSHPQCHAPLLPCARALQLRRSWRSTRIKTSLKNDHTFHFLNF